MAPKPNAVLDFLHRGTVYFLAGTTVYLGVEVLRASWYIQKNKYEKRAVSGAWRTVQHGPGLLHGRACPARSGRCHPPARTSSAI